MADLNFTAICANNAPDQQENFADGLADSLTKVVRVEKPHVLTYLKLRSNNSVRELTDLLKHYSDSQKKTVLPGERVKPQLPRTGGLTSAAMREPMRDPGGSRPPSRGPPSRPASSMEKQRPSSSLGQNNLPVELPGTPLPPEIAEEAPLAAPAAVSGSRPQSRMAQTGAEERGDAENAVAEEKEAARLAKMNAFPVSAYKAAFTGCWLGGEAERRKKKEAADGKAAFAKVWRPECVEGLERWKAAGAGEKRVKALAEKCRGLYSVWNRMAGPKTHYRSMYTKKSLGKHAKITKDRNRSEVPIGSIYSIDPWELEASEQRVTELMEKLRETKEGQVKMQTHMFRPKEEKQLVTYSAAASSIRESSEVKACFSICARATGRSEYRTKFQY